MRKLLLIFSFLAGCSLFKPVPWLEPEAISSQVALTGATCTIARDAHGHIKRSKAVAHAFNVLTGHPHGWPGHVRDHIVPLCGCGRDDVSNLQWQTIADAKVKDRVERKQCSGHWKKGVDGP